MLVPEERAKVAACFRNAFLWNFNAIDGNQLSREAVDLILDCKDANEEVRSADLLSLIGLDGAYDYMFSCYDSNRVGRKDLDFFFKKVFIYNDVITTTVLRDNNEDEVGTKAAIPAFQDVPLLYDLLVLWLNEGCGTRNPVVYAAQAHLRITALQPFRACNCRIARLVMNTILIQSDYLPLIIGPAEKDAYYEAMRAYNLGKGSADDFVRLIATLELKSQEEYMKHLGIEGLK